MAALHAGALGDTWVTASPAPSMANEIEIALAALITLPPDDDPTPRRALLVAIAQGVITYLRNNADALPVSVPAGLLGTLHGSVTVNTI